MQGQDQELVGPKYYQVCCAPVELLGQVPPAAGNGRATYVDRQTVRVLGEA